MTPFLTSVLAGLSIASAADFNLDSYPVDLTPVPFIVDVKLTDNKAADYLLPMPNPFN